MGSGNGTYQTVGWGWDITNFVWWIGIGHAGTLISAILLLFRQLAYGGKPGGGSDDHFRGNVRRPVSDLAYGPCLVGLLYHALPQYPGSALAEFQLSPAVGRICRLDIFYRLFFILVLRVITRFGDGPGPGQTEVAEVFLWHCFIRLVGFSQALAAS